MNVSLVSIEVIHLSEALHGARDIAMEEAAVSDIVVTNVYQCKSLNKL